MCWSHPHIPSSTAHCLLIVIASAAFCPNSPTMDGQPVPPGRRPPGLSPPWAASPIPGAVMVGHWLQILDIGTHRNGRKYMICDVYDHIGGCFRLVFEVPNVYGPVDLNRPF